LKKGGGGLKDTRGGVYATAREKGERMNEAGKGTKELHRGETELPKFAN